MPDFSAARLNMVESQVRTSDVTDLGIQDAMRVVPREAYCAGKDHLAYADLDVEYAPGRHLLKPRDLGKLLQALKPRPGERALAIAAPYAAAVLRHIGLDVREADPAGGAGLEAGYDLIVCEGAVDAAPAEWLALLNIGGRLGVVERAGPVGRARIYQRSEEGVGSRVAFDATAPVMPEFQPRKSFAF